MLHFMKIRPGGAELLHADRQTEVTKLTVAFRNFLNTLNNNDSAGEQLTLNSACGSVSDDTLMFTISGHKKVCLL